MVGRALNETVIQSRVEGESTPLVTDSEGIFVASVLRGKLLLFAMACFDVILSFLSLGQALITVAIFVV